MAHAMIRLMPALPVLAASLCLTACTSTAGQYPSLAKREAERVTGPANPAQSPEPAAMPFPDPELEGALAALVASASRAQRAFNAQQGPARRAIAVAQSSARGSDSWMQAHVELAELQASRSSAMIALTDLDALFTKERLAQPGALSPSAIAIAAARDEVEAIVAQQDRAIASMLNRLGT